MDDIEIQLMSDLHLEALASGEYDVFEIAHCAPFLGLLGDIGRCDHTGLYKFLETQLEKYRLVFFLLGNHEPYRTSWESSKTRLRRFKQDQDQKRRTAKGLGELVILDQSRYDVSDNVTILGCTLYSSVLPAQSDRVSFGLQDFYEIHDWTVEQHNEAHDADLAWLNREVERLEREAPHRRIIIMTHHCPTLDERTIDPAHANSPISSGFATDLSKETCWTSKNVRIWAFGHTHFNCDFLIETTGMRVVANQRGYYFAQAQRFEPKFVVRI